MILDSDSLEFVEKSLTRTDAKKVHKDLPEGGVWRTMSGHHIYIVNGKIVAGSVPGVTKAKKMTKATMAEHQAKIDAEGKKKGAKSKSGDSKKATVNASKKSGENTSGAKGTQSKKAGKGAKAVEPPAKGTKADGTATKPTSKTKTGTKGAKSSATLESTGNGKSVSGTKKSPSEGKPTSAAKGNEGASGAEPKGDEHLEIYHGTALPTVEKIMKGGFKVQGGHSDFGQAAYFKSPTFDHKDAEDFQKWVSDRKAKGQPVPERYLSGDDWHGYDTKNIVRFFTDKKEPAVIKALIPKKHVLDCSNGRPAELQKLIKDHEKHELEGTKEAMMGYTMKHALGMNVEGKDKDQLSLRWGMPETQKKLKEFFGRDIHPFKVSPYEIYAKKNNIAAIVDKLDVFKEEGWQIGVYDPKLIQIKDTGKGLNRTDKGVELMKALSNSSKAMPYCLLHHEMTDEGLVMHIGAQGGGLSKSISTGLKTKRSAFNVANPEECIYIPLNRLRTVYQTEKATNWDKVMENHKRMIAGENLDPVSIGLDYDVHDGHHRIEASRKAGYEHVPCVVKGGNDIERKRAIEAYREVWKSIQTDPVAPDAFEDDEPYMFRGIGQKEMDFIRKNGYIQTKGKGNDDDKDAKTCFSNLYSQAAGYARSNYDLYNEKHAYVLALPKLEGFEDETGEIAIPGRVSIIGMKVIPIPNTDIVKSFDESKHPRDNRGRFVTDPVLRKKIADGVRTAKDIDFTRKRVVTRTLTTEEENKFRSILQNHVLGELFDDNATRKPFDRDKAVRAIGDLKKMGFRRTKNLDMEGMAFYGADFKFRKDKSLIVTIGIGTNMYGSPHVSVNITRYKDEAHYKPNENKPSSRGDFRRGRLW